MHVTLGPESSALQKLSPGILGEILAQHRIFKISLQAAGAAPKEGMTAELDKAELEDDEGAAGVEVTDADMSDADDAAEEDGVTPQKRKTPPGDAVRCQQ